MPIARFYVMPMLMQIQCRYPSFPNPALRCRIYPNVDAERSKLHNNAGERNLF